MKCLEVGKYFGVNCYILESSTDNSCILVDPGAQKEYLRKYIEAAGKKVTAILLTHAHFDHIGAIDAFPVPVYVGEHDYDGMFDNHVNCFEIVGGDYEFDINTIDLRKLSDGDKIPFGDSFIEVMETPGHTKGGVCYIYKGDVLCGDTIFKRSYGRCDFPGGDYNALKNSIVKILKRFSNNTVLYSGHSGPTTVGYEKQFNPILSPEDKKAFD